jgi:hypothetical protein
MGRMSDADSASPIHARRQLALVIVLVLLLASVTLGAYISASRPTAISPPIPSETDDHCPRTASPAAPSPRMSAAMDKLMRAGGVDETIQHPPPGYAGILPCADTLELFVFWKGRPTAAVTAAIARLDLKVTVAENAPHTSTELRKTFDRVFADRLYWEQQGVHIEGGSLRVDGRWCRIDVLNDQTAPIQELMNARYPNDDIRVAHTEPLVPL